MKECEDAEWFATLAHWSIDQRRKGTNEPYIYHPMRVAKTIQQFLPNDHNLIRAAWLHDVVEDTGVDISTIQKHFGDDVSRLVDSVTDYQTPADGNRVRRKYFYRVKIGHGDSRVKSLKTADALDNVIGISSLDPKFAVTYINEIDDLIPFLEGAEPSLLRKLKTAVAVNKLLAAN